MLYTLGALRIEVAPFNVHDVGQSAETDYAVKPVVGIEPPLEYVGEGANEITLSGRLFPTEIGGLSELETLWQMRASGRPQFVMRGDGRPLGWHAILNTQAKSSYLDAKGVGKLIEVSVSLRRDRTPPATAFFSLMSGLMR